MRVIKNINNNVVLCEDQKGNELIAFGKGLGFQKPPYEVSLDRIQRTFYNVDSHIYTALEGIDDVYFQLAIRIVDGATSKLDLVFNSNIVFTLADHISFAVTRFKNKMTLKLPIYLDIQHLYPEEYLIGKKSLSLINENVGVVLPEEEASAIALHLINSELRNKEEPKNDNENKLIKLVVTEIETFFNQLLDKRSFNYARFITHLEYMVRRTKENNPILSSNYLLFESLKETYPKTYSCVLSVQKKLINELNISLSDEEMLYLVLHINRLYAREDCYR